MKMHASLFCAPLIIPFNLIRLFSSIDCKIFGLSNFFDSQIFFGERSSEIFVVLVNITYQTLNQ